MRTTVINSPELEWIFEHCADDEDCVWALRELDYTEEAIKEHLLGECAWVEDEIDILLEVTR